MPSWPVDDVSGLIGVVFAGLSPLVIEVGPPIREGKRASNNIERWGAENDYSTLTTACGTRIHDSVRWPAILTTIRQ